MRGEEVFLINKTVFAILVALILLITVTSCEANEGDMLEYMKEPFFMEIDGEIDGIDFSARLFCDPTEHLTKEIYEKMIISFSVSLYMKPSSVKPEMFQTTGQ